MTPAKERALGRARARVATLEEQLGQARIQLEAVEATLSEPLRGAAVADRAIDVLERKSPHKAETGTHYIDWFQHVQGEDGVLIGGEDPLATFLTAITRHPRVVSCGARTGRYRIIAT